MLHLRVVSPTALTDEVEAIISNGPTAIGLVVLRGVATRPAGDVVEADIPREVANDLVDRLRATGVHHDGTIHIDTVATWLSRSGFDAELEAPGSSADAVVWSEVAQRSYDESELNWTYLTFMTLATVLAAIAIVLDSQILVIGAMVLGPEFGPVAALGVALVLRRWVLLALATRTLILGFVAAIAITAVLALVVRLLGWVTVDELRSPHPNVAFIASPDRWSFIVALVAGAAGVISVTSSKLGGLTGVFISVTTVPAAGNIALGTAFGLSATVWGSAEQLVVNLIGMALAGWLTLLFQQAVWSRIRIRRAHSLLRRRRRMM